MSLYPVLAMLAAAGAPSAAACLPTRTCVSGEVAVAYDFSDGKRNGASADGPDDIAWTRRLRFEADAGGDANLMARIIDATGQSLVFDLSEMPSGRQRYWLDLEKCTRHWGGADDGWPHYPLKQIVWHVENREYNRPGGVSGTAVFGRPVVGEWPEADRPSLAGAEGASCTPMELTDFCEPHEWNPRRWKCFGASFSNGTYRVDFGVNPHSRILNSVAVPVVAENFLLTVEAPAEMAGTRFGLMMNCNVGGGTQHGLFGRLPAAAKGEATIRHTFVLTGRIGSERWSGAGKNGKKLERRPRFAWPSRVVGLTVFRDLAPKRQFEFRLVSLKASGPAGRVRPAIWALPPAAGAEPPSAIAVRVANGTATTLDGDVEVTATDWEGGPCGRATVEVKGLESGTVRLVKVKLPQLPEGRNYFGFVARWREEAGVKAGVQESETSWTRPPEGAGTADLRPDLPWGMNIGLSRSADMYEFGNAAAETDVSPAGLARMRRRAELARKMGVKWERLSVSPRLIRPDHDTWDWSFTDSMVDAMTTNGICGYGCLMWFPDWTEPYSREARRAYLDVARNAAKRYRGRICGWEIWNEPDTRFWAAPKDQYYQLVGEAFDKIRESDPDVPVIALSSSGPKTAFAQDLVARRWNQYTDFSFHAYRPKLVESVFLADIARMSAIGGGCKVWISEMGWATGGQAIQTVGEREQAANMARAYMAAAGSGHVRAMNGYDLIDDGFNPDYSEERYGVLRRNLAPKPSCRALATVFRTFTEGKGKLEGRPLRDVVTLWTFHMGDKCAVWTDSPEPSPLRVATDGHATMFNLMGETLATDRAVFNVSADSLRPVFFTRPLTNVTSSCDKP